MVTIINPKFMCVSILVSGITENGVESVSFTFYEKVFVLFDLTSSKSIKM